MRVYEYPLRTSWEALCKRPVSTLNMDALLEEVFDDVKKNGDEALRRLTNKFDGVDITSPSLLLPDKPVLEPNLRRAIDVAYKNIRAFHRSQLKASGRPIQTMPGVTCWQETRPIDMVGLYIPGGSAPLFSTVLMLGIPAQLAGCQQVVLCSPPNKDGKLNEAIVYAAQLCGIQQFYLVGGSQAIAAMAVGTVSVPRVDKIFGPGNQYVTAAKLYAQRFGVAIDMPAGPSEVMVLADSSARPDYVAADLPSQAEHGSDSQVVLVTNDKDIVPKVQSQLQRQLVALPRRAIAKRALQNSFAVILKSKAEMLDFANSYAPEHVIVSLDQPEQFVTSIRNAGSVFLGNYTPESAGDYASGTNHTLPTNGWARSYGGVGVDSFTKQVTFQSITEKGLNLLGPTITTMAEAEGLLAHAKAVAIRTNNNLGD
jgi:histidinol dehydrogenase